MIDLLADPGMVALFGTFGGAMLLKGIESVLKKRKAPEVKRMTFKEIADSEPVNPVVCMLWDQRRFERELVEAGIETELSVCENKECRDCYPVLKKPLPTIAPDKVRRRDTHAIEVACSNCQDVFWFTGERGPATFICKDCREQNDTLRWRDANAYSVEAKKAQKQKEFMAKLEYQNSRSGAQRVANVSGRMVPIPNNVPKHATGSYLYSSMTMQDGIGWEWEVDGQKMRYFVAIDPRMFDEFPLAKPVLVAQEYVEEQIKNVMELPPSLMSPEPTNEVCFNCEYGEIEIDQLLDAAVVFKTGTCPDHPRVDFMGYNY